MIFSVQKLNARIFVLHKVHAQSFHAGGPAKIFVLSEIKRDFRFPIKRRAEHMIHKIIFGIPHIHGIKMRYGLASKLEADFFLNLAQKRLLNAFSLLYFP